MKENFNMNIDILVIVAMKEELDIFDNNWKHNIFKNIEYYQGKISNKNIIVCFSKIGKANAAYCIGTMINEFNPNLIINIGSSGSINKDIFIDDIVIGDKFIYLDVDATIFNYKLGQVPQEKHFFETNNESLNKIFNSLKDNYKLKIGTIGTSDSFLTKSNYKKYKNIINEHHILCADMESTSIAQICDKLNKNLLSIKLVVDSIFNKKYNYKKWDSDLENKKPSIEKLLLEIINIL